MDKKSKHFKCRGNKVKLYKGSINPFPRHSSRQPTTRANSLNGCPCDSLLTRLPTPAVATRVIEL